MVKKHFKLEYLESFIGKQFLCTTEDRHCMVLGLAKFKYAKGSFNTHLEVYSVSTKIPLKTKVNCIINVNSLVNAWVPLTDTARLLYVE